MTFRNRTPLFAQTLSLILALFWAAAVALVAIGGLPGGLSALWTWSLLAFFGLGAAGFLLHAARRPAVTLEVRADRALILTESVFGFRRRTAFEPEDLRGIRIEQGEDQDGAPYHRAIVILDGRGPVTVAEGHDPRQVAEVADALRGALA